MFKTSIMLALAGAALVAAPVSAAETDDKTVGITYNDLDLNSAEGRAELDRRIDRAAKQVCGMSERPTGSNLSSRASRDCYRDAKAQLDRQLAQVVSNAQYGG